MTPGINRQRVHGFLLAAVNASTCYPAALQHLRNPSLRTEASVSWIVVNIHWIMILSGVLTMTMVYAALAPDAALRSTFGESVSGPVADIVVRNWGALIALVGAMLIFAARKPVVRPMALTVAGAAKAIFVALVLSHGGRFLGYQAGIAVLVDVLWVMIFAAYLLSVRRTPAGDLKVGSVETT
jgi:hypothetical protein